MIEWLSSNVWVVVPASASVVSAVAAICAVATSLYVYRASKRPDVIAHVEPDYDKGYVHLMLNAGPVCDRRSTAFDRSRRGTSSRRLAPCLDDVSRSIRLSRCPPPPTWGAKYDVEKKATDKEKNEPSAPHVGDGALGVF